VQADPADQRRGGVTEWGLAAAMAALAHPVAVLGAAVAAVALWAFGVGFLSGPVVAFGLASLLGALSGRGGLPGHALRPEAEPALASLVTEVARRVGFAEPLLVRAVPVPDAALATVRVQGVRARVMLLGLPLLRRLSEAELAGVVAHELAHDARAHDRRTTALLLGRAALADSLERSVHVPSSWAAHLLRATQPRAWELEHAADSIAATAVGTTPVRDGLLHVGPLAAAFHVLGGRWMATLGDDRYPADLYDALDEAAHDPAIAARMAQVAEEVDEEDPIGASSHPPVAARLAALPVALDRWPAGPAPVDLVGSAVLADWGTRALAGADAVRSTAPGPGEPLPVQVRTVSPEELELPSTEALTALQAATGGADTLASVKAVCSAIADGRWLEVAARIDPVAAEHAPPGARESYLRESLAGAVGRLLADLLRERGWERGSRWSASVLRGPDGSTVDLRAVVDRSVRAGDPAPVLALLDGAAQ
jgi:hypothetical protein